jgi:hypothetical protein
MPTPRQLRTLALVTCIVAAQAPCAARAEETAPANVAAAKRHYDKARAEYAGGAYREAIGELEAAHALDPNAKDLVFNLAVVHEKLGDVDDALRWYRLYATMPLTPQEQERADATIRRIEGAKRELDQKPTPQADQPPPPPPPPRPVPRPPPSNVDAVTIAAASVAGAALLFGGIAAAKAEIDKPTSSFVTGQDGSYAELESRTHLAHREAVIADVGFGVFVLGAATAAYFFLSRPHAVPAARAAAKGAGGLLADGGWLGLKGVF